MLKQLSIRKRLFIYISIIFAVFTILVMLFQYQREKEFKTKQLENTLYNIAEFTHNYIEHKSIFKNNNFDLLDSIKTILPAKNIRITVITKSGKVVYDSEVKNYRDMENHLQRPEVQVSISNGYGANIRTSATTGNNYYYYAKYYSEYFVRTAALYNIEVKNFLQAGKLFLIYLLFLFFITLLILHLITKNFGETITKLKDFSVKLNNGEEISDTVIFPKDELGTIGNQLVNIYSKLQKAKDKISVEKNKLFSHLEVLNEGIAFFSSDKNKILANNRFIQFLNLISEQSAITAEKVFEVKDFKPIVNFIDKQLKSKVHFKDYNLPKINIDLKKGNKYFSVQCIFFQDNDFEIIITDTTRAVKRKLLKQQMTSNIAHELKTPVATVLGYMETLQNNNLEKDKQQYFLEKAIAQAQRLSILIEDISLLNKIEEVQEYFEMKPVSVNKVVTEVYDNLKLRLNEKNISVDLKLTKEVIINGNQSLLFSIFYNLFDNVIKYGGENIEIVLGYYLEDENYFYFSFLNTGNSIEQKHLSRLFERFYRVDAGRSRRTGGTGLGLAIVKNAIILHGGEISARNVTGGGVEFLFTLKK